MVDRIVHKKIVAASTANLLTVSRNAAVGSFFSAPEHLMFGPKAHIRNKWAGELSSTAA